MKDQFGRTIDYMRISITDRCNLRCRYCMPERIEWLPKEELLSLEEIAEICRLASSLGIRKIKITGGEPLVRNGCDRLIGMISQIPGIDQVSLTTNGILLADYAESLRRQGLHSAIHGKFCNSCNRIRLTATGDLKPCLCYQERILVKDALRSGDTKEAQKLLAQAIFQKPAAHCFETLSSITEDAEMSRIGG